MPDEAPETQPITLLTLLNERWAAHAAQHNAEQRAVEVALGRNDKKLEDMNDIRGQLNRQAGTFPTRDYLDAKLDGITLSHQKDMSNIGDRITTMKNEELRARETLSAALDTISLRLNAELDTLSTRLTADLNALSTRLTADLATLKTEQAKAQSRSWTMGGYAAVATITILILMIAYLITR